MHKDEKIKLSALIRLLDYYGWTDLILNHVSFRINDSSGECYLMNPFGMLYSEVTASSIVKINKDGELLEETSYQSNPAGVVIHGAVYEARPDINCVIHTHTPNGMALSSIEGGIDCIDQMSLMFYKSLSYHDLEGIAVNHDEKKRLAQDLGDNDCMILRNHGLLACGKTIAEAFWNYYYLELACEVQIKAMSTGRPLNSIRETTKNLVLKQHQQYNKQKETTRSGYPSNAELAFEALVRVLDKKDATYKL